MNIELLGKQVISILRSKFDIPDKGILAGGSIANLIWELVSGNKAVINDIDVFVLENITKYNSEKRPLFLYKEDEIKYLEDYSGMSYKTNINNFYRIKKASKIENGIINIIEYESNVYDPMMIIKSFDINCTQIGYSLEDDKFYWTKDFEYFLQTGDLKVTNLTTPVHTAIRISKKSKELNCKLSKFELEILQHTILYSFSDIIRTRFKEKYYKMFIDNKDILLEFFEIEECKEIQEYIKLHFNDNSKIWTLISSKKYEKPADDQILDLYINLSRRAIFNDCNLDSITKTPDFLFYIRNVFNCDKLKEVWSKVNWFFNDFNYVDCDVTEKDLDLLHKISIHSPNSINNLKGYKISEQLDIIKKLLDKYSNDPIIAISILEKIKIDKDIVLDDDNLLLLELSVRKEIVNDTKGKVSKILE
jgi:hypothetical protein